MFLKFSSSARRGARKSLSGVGRRRLLFAPSLLPLRLPPPHARARHRPLPSSKIRRRDGEAKKAFGIKIVQFWINEEITALRHQR